MNRRVLAALLVITIMFALAPCATADEVPGDTVLASVGDATVTYDMAHIYVLQNEAAKAVIRQYGYAEYADGLPVMDAEQAVRELATLAGVMLLAKQSGISVPEEELRTLVREELVDYPTDEGADYFRDYAEAMLHGYGGSAEALIESTIPVKAVTVYTEKYILSLLDAHKDGRASDAAAASTHKALEEGLSALVIEKRFPEAGVIQPAMDMLDDNIQVLRRYAVQ